MTRPSSLLFFALPAALMLAPPAGAVNTSADLSKLSEATVALQDVSQPGKPGKSFAAGTVIHAPLATVCAAIQDFAGYPGFMPNVDRVKVTPAGQGDTLLDLTLKLPMGKVKQYRLRMRPKGDAGTCHLAWKLVPSPGLKPEETIADTSGDWDLAAQPSDPERTVVRYRVYTDPGPVPLGLGWIVDSLSKDSIPTMLEALRKRSAP